MKIAIPSHKRLKMLNEKTLSLLLKQNNLPNIYIFASTESFEEYNKYFKLYNKIKVIESFDSILEKRNHIIDYFNEGEEIVEMDDDIEDIVTTIRGEKSESVSDLIGLFEDSFKKSEGGLWGFNATTNSFFASGKDSEVKPQKLSLVNSCIGYTNFKHMNLTCPEKEDYERVILFYLNGKNVLKRGGYGIKTKYWKNEGGIQARYDFEKRKQVQRESAEMLVDMFGDHCYMIERKNGLVDIRFKNKLG